MKIPLLLLHGAIGASPELKSLAERLALQHDVHTMDLPGHGGAPMTSEKFSMRLFADAVVQLTASKGWRQVNIFGYSMGGYVAMYLARHHPDLVNRVVTLGTKYHWDRDTATKEIKMLDPETITAKVPAFAKRLEVLHHTGDWKKLLSSTADLLTEMGRHNPLQPQDFTEIKKDVLLMVGDRDKMVTLAETINVYQQIANAQMAILPGTPHMLEKVDIALVSYLIEKFLKVQTGVFA